VYNVYHYFKREVWKAEDEATRMALDTVVCGIGHRNVERLISETKSSINRGGTVTLP
jgi:hypothetical protein